MAAADAVAVAATRYRSHHSSLSLLLISSPSPGSHDGFSALGSPLPKHDDCAMSDSSSQLEKEEE